MLLSAPALRFANCTRAAAAAATSTALWLLCQNPNPCRPTMEAVSPKSLIAGLSNPRPLLWNPLLSQSAEPKGICSAAEQSDVSSALVVVSFYKFADFPDHAVMRMPLKDLCEELVRSENFAFRLSCCSSCLVSRLHACIYWYAWEMTIDLA